MLEPERPAKTDKAAILSDAVKAISTLRTETETLKDTNSQLREQIQELKVRNFQEMWAEGRGQSDHSLSCIWLQPTRFYIPYRV